MGKDNIFEEHVPDAAGEIAKKPRFTGLDRLRPLQHQEVFHSCACSTLNFSTPWPPLGELFPLRETPRALSQRRASASRS